MAQHTDARPLSAQELSAFSAQLALVLHAGVFLPEGLIAMTQDNPDPVLMKLSLAVEGGGKLAPAMRETGAFPEYMLGMVELGESAGKLEQVMRALSLYYEREDALKNQIKSAVFYPMMLVGVMIVVIAVLLIRVLPVFADVFAELGGAAGALSPDVAAFGAVAGYASMGVALLLLVLCAAFSLKLRTASGYASLVRAFSRVGPLTKLADKIAAGRFAFALSMLLESGYGLDAALGTLPSVVENERIARRIRDCREAMREGTSFAKAVETSGLFSGMYAHLLGVGFRTGALDSVTAKIADIYEEEINRALARLVGAVEPVLVALLCTVIGSILLGVMLPLMNIMSGIG